MQRQYTGTAGRIENAQVAVYLTYAAPAGHALIDRALYVPRGLDRRPGPPRAGRDSRTHAVRDETRAGAAMILAALDAGAPASFVAGDEVYGADPPFAQRWRSVVSGTCWPSPATGG